MTNQERVKKINDAIDDMFDHIDPLLSEDKVYYLANLTSISMSLKDISVSLAVIADKETGNNV